MNKKLQMDQEKIVKARDFKEDLQNLINLYSLENSSDTPDFILAEYMNDCLSVFNKTMEARSKWYSQ